MYNVIMLIGLQEAGRRASMTREGVRRALLRAGVHMVRITGNALAVEEADLNAFIASRADYRGMGRPRKKKPADSTESAGDIHH